MKRKVKDMTIEEVVNYCAAHDIACTGCEFTKICDRVFIGTLEVIYDDYNIEEMEIDDGTSN